MTRATLITLAVGLLLSDAAFAQFQGNVYQPDTSYQLNSPLGRKFPFAGGFNTPQMAMADLNQDGKPDLVVFEKGPELVRTFINYGSPGNPVYRYRPQYEKHFPRVNSYMKLLDYNCDEIPDLFTRGNPGFEVYRGHYQNNELHFTKYKALLYSPPYRNQESFEFTQFPPTQWTTTGTGWSRVTNGTNPTTSPQQGTGMARFNSNSLGAGSSDLLITKSFRISDQLGMNAKVSFHIYRDNHTAADSLAIYVNTSASLSNATYIAKVARSRSLNIPDTKPGPGWYEYTFEIPVTVTGPQVYLIFKGTSAGGNNIFLDNITWISSNPFGDVNAYCDPGGDIPGIADIDHDGDLDFFAFNILGAYINFYKNYQVEELLPCDSIRINLKEACWGKLYQGWERSHVLGVSCELMQPDPTPYKTTHSGNTLCFFDYDGDSDLDYLNGNLSFSDIQLLINGKVEANHFRDTIISQDTSWTSNGHNFKMAQWPAAFSLDFDQDGLDDLLLSPNSDNASENYRNVAWYRNTGTSTSPVFTYQGDSTLSRETIDVGAGSYPMIYDYDKDGRPDLFVGGDGYFQSNGTLRARISYYKNTSTPGNPAFTLIDGNFLGIHSQNIRGAYPAVGDLDNDGKDDLVVGHADGTISFYKNQAAGTGQPNWQMSQLVLKDKNNVDIDSFQQAAPFIFDIDKDGKKDLLIGGHGGWVAYYKNVGNTNELKLEHKNSRLGLAKADPENTFSGSSVPWVGKMDNTNDEYLMLGSNSGRIYRYSGLQNGNVTVPYQLVDSIYSNIYGHLSKWSGMRSAPAIADLDGDGMYEMVVGNILGGVQLFRQVMMVDVSEVASASGGMNIYPNPANEMVYFSWDESMAQESKELMIYAVTGQRLYHETISSGTSGKEVSVSELPAGTYICVLSTKTARKVARLVVLD